MDLRTFLLFHLSRPLPLILTLLRWAFTLLFSLALPHTYLNIVLVLPQGDLIIFLNSYFLILGNLFAIDKGTIAGVQVLDSNLVIFYGDFQMWSAYCLRVDWYAVGNFWITAEDDLLLFEWMASFYVALLVEYFYYHFFG